VSFATREERSLAVYVKVITTASQVRDLLCAVYKFDEWKLQKFMRPSNRTSDAVETIGNPHDILQLWNSMHARISSCASAGKSGGCTDHSTSPPSGNLALLEIETGGLSSLYSD